MKGFYRFTLCTVPKCYQGVLGLTIQQLGLYLKKVVATNGYAVQFSNRDDNPQ